MCERCVDGFIILDSHSVIDQDPSPSNSFDDIGRRYHGVFLMCLTLLLHFTSRMGVQPDFYVSNPSSHKSYSHKPRFVY